MRSLKKLSLLPVLLLAVAYPAFSLSSCGDEDVGIPCKVVTGTTDAGAGQVKVNSQSLECRSRLCIYYPGAATSQPLCTKICETDDDCPGTDEMPTCEKERFVCVVGQTVGSLKCCKMCVCKKFLAGADSGSASACKNITPNCPEL